MSFPGYVHLFCSIISYSYVLVFLVISPRHFHLPLLCYLYFPAYISLVLVFFPIPGHIHAFVFSLSFPDLFSFACHFFVIVTCRLCSLPLPGHINCFLCLLSFPCYIDFFVLFAICWIYSLFCVHVCHQLVVCTCIWRSSPFPAYSILCNIVAILTCIEFVCYLPFSGHILLLVILFAIFFLYPRVFCTLCHVLSI